MYFIPNRLDAQNYLQKNNHTKITWGNVYLDVDKMSNVIDIVSNGVRLCRPKNFSATAR